MRTGKQFVRLVGFILFATVAIYNGSSRQASSVSEVDQPIKSQTRNPDAVAVVIGIQEYQRRPDIPDVDFALNDAQAVRRVLIDTLGFSDSRILYLKNADASIGQLKPLFRQQLAGMVKPGVSDLFVYYSGHGAPNGKEGYLIPWDYNPRYTPTADSAYPLKELYADLDKLKAKNLTVILEACFSGQSDSGTIIKDASPVGLEVDNQAAMLANGVVISASGGREIATWYRDQKHGLMTYYWLRAMRGEAGDRQGILTPQGLKQYLQNNVPSLARQLRGRSQTPEVTASRNDQVLARLPVSALISGTGKLVKASGKLQITIDRGGDLTIDGVPQGTIPPGNAFLDEDRAAGPHQIEIRKDGFLPIREEVMVDPDLLTRKIYRLTSSTPDGAAVPASVPSTLRPPELIRSEREPNRTESNLTTRLDLPSDDRILKSVVSDPKATVWVYRQFSDPFANPYVYSASQRIQVYPTTANNVEKLAQLHNGQFFAMSLPPGKYYFSFGYSMVARKGGVPQQVEINLKPGVRVFLKLTRIGSNETLLTLVDSDQATEDFKKLKPVDPKDIHNSGVGTTRPFN